MFPEHLRYAPEVFVDQLCAIFNDLAGSPWDAWPNWAARLTLLPKPHGHDVLSAWRPIVIHPQIFRALIAANWRLCLPWLRRTTPMYDLNAWGADDIACALGCWFQRRHAFRKSTCAMRLDINKAFDDVSRTRLATALRELGLPEARIRWIMASLAHTELYLQHPLKEGLARVRHTAGIPQGRVDAPDLFRAHVRHVLDGVWQV